MDFAAARAKVGALVAPRNIVLVGASDKPGSWSARVWRNLNRYGFPGPIYPMNPGRKEIWERTCYADFAALPEKPDHLVVLAPAPHVAGVIRAGAAAGARSATIFSAGFGEGEGGAGEALGADLRAALAETGLGASGPNCMGNICAPARFVTLTEDRELSLAGGPVALVGQSGGVMIFMNQALEERGVFADYLITSGNEAGLSVADYIAYFAGEPRIKVIIVYIEALKRADDFRAACLAARAAGKSVVALKLGGSEEGRSAAMAHTGSLAGSLEAFDALAADCGVIRADTLDDAVEIAEFLAHAEPPAGMRLGAVTLSGAYRGLLLDAAERCGLSFPPLAAETTARLQASLGVGSLVSNPIDGGFSILTSEAAYRECIEALRADPSVDMVLLQEALPRAEGSRRAENYIRIAEDYAARGGKPIAFVTLASHGQSDYSRALRAGAPHMPFLQEANKALRAIHRAVERDRRQALAALTPEPLHASGEREMAAQRVRALAQSGETSLSESESKAILSAYGLALPRETLAASPDAAVAAARSVGFPVVVKGVSAALQHKTEAGAVILNVMDEAGVRAAWDTIASNVRAAGFAGPLDGVLVAEQVPDGLELVVGLHRDPECGLTFMAGAGGVLLELVKDVAFAAAPMTRAKARDMIGRTRAARLIAGFRGARALDRKPVEDAIMALGALVADVGECIESVDVNPFRLLPTGGRALDALLVLRRP
ncbi:MAG: acetate--CoA ligase family protein [Beijerinckiaceae bacterium]|nr:acetate--CoA ligase family protein [Beijerinckiaceae bacterium]